MVIHDKEYGLQSICYKITKVTNNKVATTKILGRKEILISELPYYLKCPVLNKKIRKHGKKQESMSHSQKKRAINVNCPHGK